MDTGLPPDLMIVGRQEHNWLITNYLSPISGAWDQARTLLRDWGYDPDALAPDLVEAMGQEMGEAIMDAGIDFMRDHGLVNLAAGEEPPTVEEKTP